MKAATDNATDLIEELTREANRGSQDTITQKNNDMVGDAQALSTQGNEN